MQCEATVRSEDGAWGPGAYTRPPLSSTQALLVGQGGVYGVFKAGVEGVFRRLGNVLSGRDGSG